MPKHPKVKAAAKGAAKATAGSVASKLLIGAAKRHPVVAAATLAVGAYGAYKGAKKLFGKKGGHAAHGRTTLQRLRAAYDKRARRFLRMGNLGMARKALMKKRLVV
jgi:hypothetical protein